MATITINPGDVTDATNFLESFLSDEVPLGDFSSGTALHDLTIGAIAAIFAYLTNENALVSNRQSLNTIQAGVVDADPASLQDAVTALLSNFFIAPLGGGFARGTALGHSSSQVDVFIQPSQRFTRSPGLVFQVDSATTYFIPAGDLLAIVDATGAILEYQFRIPLVALAVGDTFNIDPGLFSDFDKFSPYVTRIENVIKFTGGTPPETTAAILARAPTAISVRNLINDRSIQAVLAENFPTIRSIMVIGYGDPEMQRDVLTGVGTHLAIHIGGATDIYLLLDLVETSFTGVVGDFFARPDGISNIFRDADVADFTAAVQIGDILRIVAGIPGVPREFFIDSIASSQLTVSERIPFPVATDELVATNAQYTIGRVPPSFNDVISNGSLPMPHGVTSRQTKTPGRITLPGGPVMDILDVALIDPPVGEAAYKSAVDGFIHYTDHVDATPALATDPAVPLQFQTVIHNPLAAQSAQMWMEVAIGQATNLTRYDGYHLKVRYLTLSNYQAIYDYIVDRTNRPNCANQLPRGQHPVTLGMTIQYRLKPTATSTLNNAVLAQSISDFVNAFDTTVSPIDVSTISQFLKDTYPDIAAVFPFVIDYTLLAPTGDVVNYETADEVRLTDAKLSGSNPTLDLLSLGVSARTVRYLTASSNISLQDLGAPPAGT